MKMPKKPTFEHVLKLIENLDIPYDRGFDTEELMVASFRAGIVLAAKLARAGGDSTFSDALISIAAIEDDDA
jgi:hypothetical protein